MGGADRRDAVRYLPADDPHVRRLADSLGPLPVDAAARIAETLARAATRIERVS